MKNAVLLAILTSGLVLSGVARADEALARTKNCLACHMTDKKLVGPAYKDVAKRYAGKKGADAELVTSIMKGSMKGKWKDAGINAPMPPNTTVSEAEAKKLVAWILSLK